MNPGTIREMIEGASDKERKQFRAIVNHNLGNRLRLRMADAERREELGEHEDEQRNCSI